MLKPEIIRAGKVVLRPKRSEDAEDDYAWRCDEELAELDATTPLMQPFRQFLRYYEEDLKHPSPWSLRLAIDDLDGNHIGNVMCYDINAHFGEAELGIMIGNRDYWSKSFGYHTMVGLIDHIFRATDLKRLYLHTLDWNVRAQNSFRRCGFRSVRTVRRNGRDLILMELTRDYWLQNREEKLLPLREAEALTQHRQHV